MWAKLEYEVEIRKADFFELSAQSRMGSPLPTVGGRDDTKEGDIPFML